MSVNVNSITTKEVISKKINVRKNILKDGFELWKTGKIYIVVKVIDRRHNFRQKT